MRTKILKANAHFAALNLFISKKGLKQVLRCLSTMRTWMLISILWTKAMIEETEFYRRRGFYSVFENFIPAHSLEDENRLAEIRDVLPERNQAIPSTNTNKHPCKHTCTWSSWQAPCPIAVFCSKSKKIYSCMYSVHCLVNSICWFSCICLTFVMFQPSYCNFFFSYFCFPPRLAIGYLGKDQLWLVSKVFLINLKLELDQRKEDGRD